MMFPFFLFFRWLSGFDDDDAFACMAQRLAFFLSLVALVMFGLGGGAQLRS